MRQGGGLWQPAEFVRRYGDFGVQGNHLNKPVLVRVFGSGLEVQVSEAVRSFAGETAPSSLSSLASAVWFVQPPHALALTAASERLLEIRC